MKLIEGCGHASIEATSASVQTRSKILSEGMVRGTKSIQIFGKMLGGEVDRIEHLVENIFAFAQFDLASRELALEDFFIADKAGR